MTDRDWELTHTDWIAECDMGDACAIAEVPAMRATLKALLEHRPRLWGDSVEASAQDAGDRAVALADAEAPRP